MKKYILIGIFTIIFYSSFAQTYSISGIKPMEANSSFWQYKGHPILLIGGSSNDNLFQNADVYKELDLLVSVGGNYVRNTMCSDDEGNEKPFWRSGERYNLDKFNNEYWEALNNFLRLTADRNIIVQLEIWSYAEIINDWDKSPWNPVNNNVLANINDPGTGINKKGDDFFLSIQENNNDSLLLKYQKLFVDKLLSISLAYEHVIYSISGFNLNQQLSEWNLFWANYIRKKVKDKTVEIGDSEISFESVDTDKQSDSYTYFDFSGNSLEVNESHWTNLCFMKNILYNNPVPLNNVSVAGGQLGDWTSGPAHAVERFWRNLVGGAAALRFEAEPFGLGLSERAQMHLKSAQMLISEYDFFTSVPDEKSSLILEREEDEAYLARNTNRDVLVYFTDGGQIVLDFTDFEGNYSLKWLNLEGANWYQESMLEGGGILELTSPYAGNWVALLSKSELAE